MDKSRKTIIFCVRGVGEYTDALTAAESLIHEYRIVMVNESSLEQDGHEYIKSKAKKLGCICYDLPYEFKRLGKVGKCTQLMRNFIVTIPLTAFAVLYHIFQLSSPRVIFRSLLGPYTLIINMELFNKILRKEKPRVLILNNVNGGVIGQLFIVCARKQKIKSLLIPLNCMTPVAPARILFEDEENIAVGKKLGIAKRFFPEWLYLYSNRYLLRRPLLEILAIKLLQASPPLPWVQDSSTADVMLVESPFMKDHYDRLGLKHDDMRIAGKPNLDYLFSSYIKKKDLVNSLYQELDFNERKPIILLAIPPRFTGLNEKGRASEFRDYEEVVAFLLDAASQIENFNILVSVHPRERARLNDKLFKKSSLPKHIRYSLRDTAELMAVSELYIMAGSTTVLWALALKIPVIDYDVYGFKFNFYEGNPDIQSVSSKNEFLHLLQQVDKNPNYLLQRKCLFNERGHYYGLLDGKNIERTKQVVDELSAN